MTINAFHSEDDRSAAFPRRRAAGTLCALLAAAGSSTALGCDDAPDGHDNPPAQASAGVFAAGGTGRTFEVGTVSYELADTERAELATPDPDDRREVVVRAWYPAESAPELPSGGYFSNPREALLNAAFSGLPEGAFDALSTRSRVGADLARSAGAWPVLIFSPGMSTPTAFYTRQLEELASRGYVVFALSHSYATGVVVFSDGRVAPELPEKPDPAIRDVSIGTWSDDQRFVVDRIEALAEPGSGDRFSGRLDLERLGVFGHSRGGAAATQSCLDDPRFMACADLDGSVGGGVEEHVLARPFLLMRSEIEESTLAPFFDIQSAGAHRVLIQGAGHNSFSDLPLVVGEVPGLEPSQLLLGTIEPQRGFEIITEYVAAFFDAELSGIPSQLFSAPAVYPEAHVTNR
jgi:hypothetical protein